MSKLFLLLLLSFSSGPALAVTAPTPTQMAILQTQINTVHAIRGSSAGTDPKKWTGIAGLTEQIKKENGRIDPNKKQIAAWEQQREALELQLLPLCQALIENTRFSYGIKPVRMSGKIVMPGDFDGTYADWKPQFGQMVHTRVRTNRAGHSIVMGQPDSYEAVAWANGDIVITIDAFRFSPAYLAAVINHETIHFDQFTDPKRGPRSTPLQREREAYNMMRGTSFRSVFNLSPVEMEAIETSYKRAIANATSSANGTVVGASDIYTVDLTQDPDGEALLMRTMREAKELAQRQKDRQEQERRNDHDKRLMNALIAVTRRSCDNPGSVSQAELSALPLPFNSEFKRIKPLRSADFPGRERCLNVYEYLAYAGRDAEALRKAASPTGPALLQPIAVPSDPQLIHVGPNKHPFSRVLPQYKSYAENACRSPAQIQWDSILFPAYDYSYREYDDKLIRELKIGMGDCAQKLLDYLVEIKRRNYSDTDALQPDLLREKVAAFSPVYSSPGRGSSPGQGLGCVYDPNIGGWACPKSR